MGFPRYTALLVLILLATFASGCAREALPPEVPGMRDPSAELPKKRRVRHGFMSLSIPDGQPCLSWLAEQHVAFHVLPEKPGMVTPIHVTGPIGGVTYESGGQKSLVCDCRLAVALGWLGPELRAFGIHEVHHSGAYVYRTTKSGRPSLHAQGLAIDVHQLLVGQRRFEVSRDFERGAGAACHDDARMLNRLACELSRTGLFEEVITPDDDSDHSDHLHLAIAPL
jgi:hypothetical protein